MLNNSTIFLNNRKHFWFEYDREKKEKLHGLV